MALARLVHQEWPAIEIVVTSGRNLIGTVPDDGKFMEKPYTIKEMAEVITEVCERRRSA